MVKDGGLWWSIVWMVRYGEEWCDMARNGVSSIVWIVR